MSVLGAFCLGDGRCDPMVRSAVTLAIGISLGAALTYGVMVHPHPTQVLRVQRLEITDANGKTRGYFGADSSGNSGLALINDQGQPLATMTASETESGILLSSRQRNKVLLLSSAKAGSVSVYGFYKHGGSASMEVKTNGKSSIGVQRWDNDEGSARLSVNGYSVKTEPRMDPIEPR